MIAEIPVSRTKIIVPTLRSGILHRSRLLAHFDDLLDRKLIIISAPAGYGKTSLLADYARQVEMPVCWFSLDTLDQDPQRFAVYLIAAIHQRFPKFGNLSKAALKSMLSFDQDMEHFLSVLVNEIDSQIDVHFTLIVDDYQFVDSIPDVRNLFSRFIFLAGENCHIVISSRRLPTLPDIALMVARQQVAGFTLEELAFRPNEIRSLFELNYGYSLDDQTVDELVQRTEGWITGLQLSASRIATGLPDLTRAARAAGVDISSYLDHEILAPQSPDVREFLLQTSLLEEFNVDLCEKVLGSGNWKTLMKIIRDNNLFVLQVGPDGSWLRYHHIFQDFLQKRMRENEPELSSSILMRLEETLENEGEWEKAYSIASNLNNSSLLSTLIVRAGPSLLVNERLITLQTWLNNIESSQLEKHPALLSLRGALLCTLGEGHLSLSALNRAILAYRDSSDLQGLGLALVRRSAAYRLVGDYSASLRDAEEALDLTRDQIELSSTYAEGLRFKGLSLFHLGKISQAGESQEEALRCYEKLGDRKRAAWIQMELGITYRTSDNYPKAQKAYNLALNEWRQENNLLSQAHVLDNLGVLHHFQGKYDQAVQAFEMGIKIARSSQTPWLEALLLASLGDLYLDLQELESAYMAYTKATQIAHQVNFQFILNYLSLAQARLHRLLGKNKEALSFLLEVEHIILAGGSNYETGLFYLENGCLSLADKKYHNAVIDLEQALAFFQSGGLEGYATESRIWLGIACYHAGKIEEARLFLMSVLEIGSSGNLQAHIQQILSQARPWLMDIQEDSEIGVKLAVWLKKIAQSDMELPNLRKRLRHMFTSIPIQGPLISIQAFGKGRVKLNGKLVTKSQWKTASVRTLFFYFLEASHPATKEEIGEALWPELNSAELKLRFKNEIYRLRHALGKNVIRYENELYSFNRMLDYDYDIEQFNLLLTKAVSASSLESKILYLIEATKLRTGPYLIDEDATWVLPERARLEKACTDAWLQLAECHHQSSDLQAAIQDCQEGLKIDPSREDIHCYAMQLYAEQGDRMGIIWQYQACKQALKTELDIDPSGKTEALFRRLTV
jgi:LuxR family maltose regulon positive regulatory protein